jgi:hypothetical protein
MALDADEQALFDWAAAGMPEWYTDAEIANEFLELAAKTFGASRAVVKDWLTRQTRILEADGPTAVTPDWLGLLAKDLGTSRREGETTTALRRRLRIVEDALTRPALLAGVQALLDQAGVVGTVGMVELPRDAAYFGDWSSDAGVGGTFAVLTGGAASFTPAVGFKTNPYLPVFPQFGRKLTIAGASAPANNGTFTTTGVVTNGARYANGSAVGGADPTVVWTLKKLDVQGNVVDGFAKSYFNRGFRMASKLPTIVVILPYGTTEPVRAAIEEFLRLRKAAGVRAVVEARSTPP